MTYQEVRQKIKEELQKTNRIVDVWLNESTVNALLRDANTISIKENNLVMTFDGDMCMYIATYGFLIGGDSKAYWQILSFDDYHYSAYTSEKKEVVIL